MEAWQKVMSAALTAIALGGCATGGVPYKEQADKLAKPNAADGRVFLYRSSMLGAAIQPNVTLNGVVVGSAVPMGVFYVDRPKGTYEVSASTEVEKKATFTLDPGETKYVKLTPTFGILVGRIVPELVDADTARKEMLDLTLIPATGAAKK